ncbi:MAG: glycosyltransferase family 4 protein [Candidatus Cloacimonetes bacterium]|nr:glycosyltransferase family 4 protein [Candidatus Cloacimonadota bacterium]
MSKIKSFQVIRRFAFEEWGGTETVVWNSTQKLVEKGNETEILATNALSNINEEVVNNVPIKRFNYFYPYLNLKKKNIAVLDKKGGNPYSNKLYKYLMLNNNLQILHCHTMQRIANTVRLVAHKKDIPYVISFHGGFFEVPQSEIDEMMKPLENTFNYGKIFDIILKNNRFLEDADGIICVGYNEYLITKKKYPNKVVTYLPNGVDIVKFETDKPNDFRTKFNIPTKAELLICISRIDYQKNQIKIIELHHRLKLKGEKMHSAIIGPVTSEAYYAKLKAKIDEYNLWDEVTIIEGLQADDPDLVNAFLSADYFILPSIHEPFGIVALEAWASKIPVIAHHVGGLQKLITEGETGLFFRDNSLDDLLQKFYLMREMKTEIIQNAYDEVCQKYSWDTITDKLIDFYQAVINAHKKR